MRLPVWKTTREHLFRVRQDHLRMVCQAILFAIFLFPSIRALGQAATITVAAPNVMTVCGPPETVTVMVDATSDTLRGITGAFDLSALSGIDFDPASLSSPDGVTLMGSDFQFPDLLEGESASFSIDFMVMCGATTLGGENLFVFDVNYLIDGTVAGMDQGTQQMPGFTVLQPGLDFIMTGTDIFRPVVNEPDTIVKQIANAGDGDVDSALYFVIDHPNLSLCEIFVEGTNSGVPNGNTYVLNLAGTNVDTMFYWIDAGAIATTGDNDAIWDGLAGGQESFVVTEIWKGVGCIDAAPDIVRGIGYGCVPGNSIGLCTSQDNNSAVVFDKEPDLVSGIYDWGNERPACYADDPTQVGYFITNEGEAPADTVVVNLSTSSQGDVVTYQYSLTGPTGTYVDGLTGAMTSSGCGGINQVTDTIYDANLAVGDTLWIQIEMLFDCACNPGCGISGIYESDLTVEAIDRCGDGLQGQAASWPDYAVNIGGFVEGPFDVKGGESGCVTYTITGYRNNWFNNSYPDSYYEMVFNFPAGLEIDETTVVWEDVSGDLFAPMIENFTNGDETMPDILTVRWNHSDIPAGWSAGAGTQIEICYDVVCSLPCSGETNIDVTAQMDFVIDPLCATCTQEEAFCPPPLPMVLKCYDPGVCVCEGIAVLELDISRVNYGLGDNNNNNNPEGSETIDFNLVETKRYLQGDTLKAVVTAIVKGMPGDQWINSTFQLVTQTNTITPIAGSIRVVDASAMSEYNCDALSMTVSTSPSGDTIEVDLSTITLATYCPAAVPPVPPAYEDGDTLELCLTYSVKEDQTIQQRPVLYHTIWTVDDGVNPPQSCNQESERLTQIGIVETYTVDLDNSFGGCEPSTGSVREQRYFGSRNFDEFPFEVRQLGIPEEFVYIKPQEFGFRSDLFGFRMDGLLVTTGINLSGGSPALAPYILISGDTLTFKAGDYLRSLGSAVVPPDEGYDTRFFPRVQGDCRSFVGAFDNTAWMSSSVDPITFCTPLIDRVPVTQQVMYTGGPQLLVTPDATNIVVGQPNQCIGFTLTNTTTISAPNSFLYITSPTGNAVVNSLVETTGGGMTVVPGSALGIYELGFTPGSPDRTFEICVTVNSCGTEQLNFIAGWDCNQYPTTVLEATCQDPSVVTFTTGTAGLGLLVTRPSVDTVVNLCDTILYEAILNSTMAGNLRDIVLSFDLPVGHDYIEGSFEYMWPQLPASGFISTSDPDNPYGNFFTTTITDADPILASDGLLGNNNIPNNVITIRFKVATTCDVISGSAASFFARALNACGDPVNRRFFPGKRIHIDGAVASYDISLRATDLVLNPCTQDMSQIDIDILLSADPGIMTTVGDTIRATLPPGIFYNGMSYQAGINAVITDPIITDLGGQQLLDWPIMTGLVDGDQIQFSFAVTATDASQECRDYDMLVQTFSTVGAECETSCEIGVETGSARAPFTIVKPNLVPTLFSGMLIQYPPVEEILMYTLEVFNNSTVGLPMGTVIPLKIYEDVDNSGTPTAADVLLSIDDIVIDSVPPGRSFELMASDTFPAGSACNLIAVLDPDTACVCALEPSNQLKPQIKFDFPTEIEVCSNTDTLIGPEPVPGYDYTWLPVGGAFMGALSDSDTTRTTFQLQNISGETIVHQYALRAISGSCFIYDTVTVTVYPERADTIGFPACLNMPVLLPGPIDGSDFMWTPDIELDDPTAMFPTVTPTTDRQYVLNYLDLNGCPATLVVNLSIVTCVAGTAIGDTVWFDENMNGLYDDGELPIPGAVVLLYPAINPNGPHIRVDTTDANGMYELDNLVLGNYIIRFIPPPGFEITEQDAGADDIDSDPDPANGLTNAYFLNNGETNSTVDAGLISPCELSMSVDVGPCRVSADTMLRNVDVNISWNDAVYTYDYLYGEDTIFLNYLGAEDTIIVDTLSGEALVSFTIGNSVPANFDIFAGFRLDTTCRDTFMVEVPSPCIFDLAFTKKIDSTGTSFPLVDDDTVKFLLTLYNQGTVTASNIIVKDHIPCGFTAFPSLGDLILADSTIYFAGPVLPGDSATACIYFRLQQPIDIPAACQGNNIYDNYAEILYAEDLFGDQPTDRDSEPNSNSPQELSVLPNGPGDDDILSTGIGDIGSEDDHDPANVQVLDLALRKSFDPSTPGPYFAVGDTIKYLITVFNQGNVIVDSIVVTDTLSDGLEFINGGLNPDWTDLGGNQVQFDTSFQSAMMMGIDTFIWGDSFNVCIYLRVKSSIDPGAYLNMAKISSARDTSGTTHNGDNDSSFDMNFSGNPGGAPGTLADDFVGGIGTGEPGSGDPRGDADSHDPAFFLVPVSVGDTTFIDTDLNGLQDPTDPPLPNVTVTLFQIDPATGIGNPVTTDAFGNVYDNTRTTNANGAYLFDSLPHGRYYVVFDVSTASNANLLIPTIANANGSSLDPDDSDPQIMGISDTTGYLFSNEADRTLDAGWWFPYALGDTAFVDQNLNGRQDASDPGLEGVIVTVYDVSTGAPVTIDAFGNIYPSGMMDTTDQDGYWIIDSLPSNRRYYVVFDVSQVPDGLPYLPTLENVGDTIGDSDINSQGISDTTEILSQPDTIRTLDAGFFAPVVIGDTAFVDVNFDGRQDPGDLPLEGVIVTLYDAATGAVVTMDAFGNNFPMGIMDTTDVDGFWLMDSLPPGRQYYVVFDASMTPDGQPWEVTMENIGDTVGDSDINLLGVSDTTMVLLSADTNRTLDAGYFVPVSIGDTVFVDADYDGRQDAGDQPLEGVIVTLYDAATGSVVDTDAFGNVFPGGLMDTTDANGFWFIDSLAPNMEYYVVFDASQTPDGEKYVSTLENVGDTIGDSDINTLGFSDTTGLTTSGDTIPTLDAGYFVPVVIGDTAWVDLDLDGQQEPGEPGLEGIIVTLLHAADSTPVTVDAFGNVFPAGMMDTTDADGFYLLDSLIPGDYIVFFDLTMLPGMPPVGPTLQNVPPDDEIDSDVSSYGYSDPTGFMSSGDTILTIDAGYVFPEIKLAKGIIKIAQAASGVAGNLDVTFKYTIHNTGGTFLDTIDLQDDLPGQLGSSFVEVTAVPVIASDGGSGVTASSIFVGSTPGTSILSGTDGHLHYDSIICVEVVVELDPNTPVGLDSLKNQAIVSGDPTFPDGAPVVLNGMPMPAQVDSSDSGLIPDSTNPDDPGDLGTESDSTLLWLPGINLSKGLVNVEQVSDPINSPSTAGNVIATFKYTVKNTGNTTLNHVELSDDLINQLGGIFVQIDSIGEPMGLGIGVLHNAAWNGDTDTTLISSGQLLPNDSFMISVFLELNPNALSPVVPPTNQAHVEATPWDTLTMDTLTGVSGINLADVQDSSDSGILTESQNFGAPGDSGGSNDPTLVYLPNVNLSKEVTKFQLLMAPPDAVGNFAVTYQFKIKNTGNVPLDSLTLYDNIFDQYGGATGAFVRVRPDSMVRILDGGGTSILANPDFDGGVTDSALTIPLIGPGGSLQPDSTICVQVTLEINPNAMNLPNDPLLNQAIVDARPDDGMGNGLPGPDGLLLEMISDLSDSGTDPEDVNDDAFLADPGYTNDSTALQLSDLNIAKEIIAYESNYNDTLPGDARMRFAVRIKNKGNIPINNVVVYDDIEEEFGAAFKEILEQPVYFVEENTGGFMPAVINPAMGMNLPGDSVLFTADALQPNVQMRIEFEIRIDPNAVGRPTPLLNQASVEGETVVGGVPVMLMDISDSGSDPESSNPDALGDTGGENDPTLAPAPSINLAKTIPFPGVRIGSRPKNLIVTHILRIKNTGNVTLDSLRLSDPVGDAVWYGKWGAFVRIPTTPMILHQPSDGQFEINPDFDGLSLGDSEVFLPSADRSDSIPVNDSLVIKVEVEINTEVVPHDQDSILLNQAVAYGTGLLPDGSRGEQEDESDSGVDPESNNETDPLRLSQDLADMGHNDPTPLPNCFWCPTPCLDEVNTSFDENCQADIVEIMKGALRGVQPICVDLGFFDFEIKNEFGGLVSNPVSGENVKDEKCFKVSANNILCPYDPCWTNVCIKRFDTPIFQGRKTTVYCGDPLVEVPDPFEERFAIVSCQGQIPATFTGDWARVFDCEPGVQDTVKIIYREYEATSNAGFRGTGYDTICVLRLPEISVDNIYCPPMDTTYCGVGDRIGPYMVVDGIDGAGCERLYFLNPDGTAAEFDAKCGLSIHVEKFDFPSAGCINQTRYDVQVYQSCYGASVNQNCTVENTEGPHFEVTGGSGDAVILSCSFWVMDFDTTAPVVECRLEELGKVEEVNGVDAVVIEATSNDCSTASASLPPVSVLEACGTVKLVKARLEGVGTFIYRFNPSTGLFETDEVVDLPLRDEPYELIFEGVDDCHNIGQDRCYLIVQDPIIPVAVAHKGLTLSLGSKKVWLAAEDLDNGSYDNCNLNIVLARRTDWLTACVDLCDSLVVDHVTSKGDTVWCVYLSDDQLNDEVERSYRETVEWLNEDGGLCEELVADAWYYDLCRYATVDCKGSLTEQEFAELFAQDAHGSRAAQLGGGWSASVPFDCSDACAKISVELLVMDYWCNWSTSWTDILVEDKSPVEPVVDVTDTVTISCTTYKNDSIYTLPGSDDSLPLAEVMERAQNGDADALSLLNDALGGYHKAWRDPYGQYVDAMGNPIDAAVEFTDRGICTCTTSMEQVTYYDEQSQGWVTEEQEVTNCYYDESSFPLANGILEVNCGENSFCSQAVEIDLDECCTGTITRLFKIWKECPQAPEEPDTLFLEQVIQVGDTCTLRKEMFDLPEDVELFTCAPEYDPAGSGNVVGDAHPDSIGRPQYLLDSDCRIIGIAHEDKVFSFVGSQEGNCYKIERTWYFANWCGQDAQPGTWWEDEDVIADTYVQKIILRDTVPPDCEVLVDQQVNDSISVAACSIDLEATVQAMDNCNLKSYDWTLRHADGMAVDNGTIESDSTAMQEISFDLSGVEPGTYHLMVRVLDHCMNESYCRDTFTVVSTLQPALNCVGPTGVELVGMDTGGGPEPDTATSTVFAEPLVISSSVVCNDTGLIYRIEDIDGIGDDTYEDDADSLVIGCGHVGDTLVRVWVVSMPSGNASFCDVLLQVTDSENVCQDISRSDGIVGVVQNELGEIVHDAIISVRTKDDDIVDAPVNENGRFKFMLPLAEVSEVEVIKDKDDREGVSTADLIKIQKHLLAQERLPNKFRKRAADANKDGKVTALDIITIRKLILGLEDEFPNSHSWRFYHHGSDQEVVSDINSGENGIVEMNWTGVKVGDVNLDYDPSRAADRSHKRLDFVVPDIRLEPGYTYHVPFTAPDLVNIEGYQFTIALDTRYARFIRVSPGRELDMDPGHFGQQDISSGKITTSWNRTDYGVDLNVPPTAEIFSLVIEGRIETVLSDIMTINSSFTKAEAYNNKSEILEVGLQFSDDILLQDRFALLQNRPNPFRGETLIGFYLPEEGSATLTIYDVHGKVLKQIEGYYAKGYHEVEVKKRDLRTSGILYYQLDSDKYTATKKMILVH